MNFTLTVPSKAALLKSPIVFVILLSYFSLFALGLSDNLRGTLFPEIMRLYGLSNSEGSWFFISTSTLSILGGLLAPSIARKASTLQTWRLGVLLMGIGSLLIALAPNFRDTLIGGSTLGLGFGLLGVMQNLLITNVSRPPQSQKILSGLHSMYGFSSFLSPVLVTFFTQRHWSWKYLFAGVGVFSFFLLLTSLTQTAGEIHRKDAEPEVKDPEEEHPEAVGSRLTNPMTPQKSSGRLKVAFALLLGSYVAMELLMSSRLTTYLTQHLHWSLEQASRGLTLFFAALLGGRVLFSFFHFPLSLKKTLLLSLLGSFACILFGLRVDPFFLSLSGFFMAPFYPLAISFMAEAFPDQLSSMMGFTISLQSAFVIGMNLLIGSLADQFGIAMAMNSAFLFGGVSWLLLMVF